MGAAIVLLTAAGAAAAEQRDEDAGAAAKFIHHLLERGSVRAVRDPAACLHRGPGAATPRREIAAILALFIEESLPLTVSARCQPARSPLRQHCALTFSGRRDEIEASAGFTFLGNPAAGDIDLRTVQCFHTP